MGSDNEFEKKLILKISHVFIVTTKSLLMILISKNIHWMKNYTKIF